MIENISCKFGTLWCMEYIYEYYLRIYSRNKIYFHKKACLWNGRCFFPSLQFKNRSYHPPVIPLGLSWRYSGINKIYQIHTASAMRGSSLLFGKQSCDSHLYLSKYPNCLSSVSYRCLYVFQSIFVVPLCMLSWSQRSYLVSRVPFGVWWVQCLTQYVSG